MRAGVLSGSRLALRVTGAVEIYTPAPASPQEPRCFVSTGLRTSKTASSWTVTLRRLSDDNTARIHTRDPVRLLRDVAEVPTSSRSRG